MNYLDSLKQQYPEITKYSDDEIISVLPKIDPSLSGMEPQTLRSFALAEQEPSGLWGLAKSGYHNVKGSRAVADAAGDLNDLNDPEFYEQDLQPRKVQTGSLLGMSGDELRRRSVASTGGEEQLMQEAQRRLDKGTEQYQKAAQYKLSPTTEQFLTGSLNPDSDILSDLMADPVTIIAELGAQSAYGSVESMLQGAAMGVVGGPAGMAVGSGTGSARIEFANSIVEGLREAGVDVTDARKLRAQLAESPDLFAQVTDKAKKRAAAVGALDGAAMGLASVPMGIGRNAATRVGTNLVFQGGVQSGLGAGGEALGQYTADGEISDMRAIAAEAAGELVTAPVDVAAATYGGMNGRNATPADRAASSTDEAIQQARQFEDQINRTSFFSGKPNGRVTAADMGLQMPEQRDWSKYDASPAERPMAQSEPAQEEQATSSQSARDMSGIDGLIITADRMGFLDEAALLRTSKRLYAQAAEAKASKQDERYLDLLERADRLYREAAETNEQVREIANQFPVPYVATGEVTGSELALSDAPNFTMPELDLEGEGVTVSTRSNQPLLTQQAERLESNNPETPFIMGRDPESRPERTFTPTSDEYEGVGRNVVELTAQAKTNALPAGNAVRAITPGQYLQVMGRAQLANRTPKAQQTPEMLEALEVRQQVRTGQVEVSEKVQPNTPSVAGEPIDQEWIHFTPESGTLSVPRAQMPQVKAEHRGALVNFLNAKGVPHEQIEVDPINLKPTQQEFAPGKVDKARKHKGGERSVLISSDGHVVDGHHQWMAKREQGEPIKAIQLQAPIRDLLPMIREFPSSEQEGGVEATPSITGTAPNTAPELRLKSDFERDDLVGPDSDRPADVAASYVQNDISEAEAKLSTASSPNDTPKSTIEDFGEVLGGARKHTYTLRNALDSDIDVKTTPLSKSFPLPDYEKLVASGVDTRALVYISVLRAAIGAKPRQTHKVRRWAEQVEEARSNAGRVLDGSLPVDDLIRRLREPGRSSHLKHLPDLMSLGAEILPAQIKDLGQYTLTRAHYSLFRGEKNVDKYVVTDSGRKAGFGGMGNQAHFDTIEEALNHIKSKVTSVSSSGKPQTKFDIWTERSREGVFLGKKVAARKFIELKRFETPAEARAYMRDHNDELTQLLTEKKKVRAVRRADNEPRVGDDHRNGKDVTPEQFSEVFGFRGVQFGNWVENDKRQQDLNQAYDGLMDLAGIIGVPPKALSLNGQLGLAFGARGKGGMKAALAHYEPSNVVINLTKKKGAGSLAHEWWHAVDNYFGRQDGSDAEYLTERRRPKRKTVVRDGRTRVEETTADDFGVREEVYDAFKKVERAITTETDLAKRSAALDNTRTKDYWSTVREMTARSFERYVIDKLQSQGYSNDYLANIVSEEEHSRVNDVLGVTEPYAYPLASEMEAVNRAYDGLFGTLQTKETDSGVALFSRQSRSTNTDTAIPLQDVERAASRIVSSWKNAPEWTVVATDFDLPAELQSEIEEQNARGQIDGVFHGGRFYLVAEHIRSESDVERIIFHEALGHYGLQQLYGPALKLHLDQLWNRIGGLDGINRLQKTYNFGMGSYWRNSEHMDPTERRVMMMDELVAHIAATGTYQPDIIQRIAHLVRQGLRKIMAGTRFAERLNRMTDVELLSIVAAARNAVIEGETRVTTLTHDPRFVRMFEEAMYGAEDGLRFSRTDSDTFAKPEETHLKVALRKIADKFQVLKDLQKNIQDSGGTVDESNDAYLAEELFHGKTEEDLRQMRETFIKPLADKMAKFGIEQAELDQYLYAKHAPERNAHIAEINPELQEAGSGMSDAKAAEVSQQARESGKLEQYEQLAGMVYDMLETRRQTMRSAGLEEDGMIDAWENKYEFYVPLKGWAADEKQEGTARTGSGFNIAGKESKRAMGRSSEAASPSSYAIQDLTETLIRRRKNEVGNALLKLVEDNPNKDYWQVFTNENPDIDRQIFRSETEASKQARKEAKKAGQPEPDRQYQETVRETPIPMAMMPDKYFQTKRDGRTYFIKLEDERLMKAMKNVGPDTSNFLIRNLGAVNRVLSSLNTSYNPEFVVGNFARDVQTAVLNLMAEQSRDDGKVLGEKIAKQTVKDIPKAMKAVYRGLRNKDEAAGGEWQKWFTEFREAGAKTGWFDMKDIDGQADDLQTLISMAKGGVKGSAMKWFKATGQMVEDLNGSVENAVRLSAYVNARKAGISQAKAASLAKNMTVNFNRRGEVGTTLNALYMFANASIQGSMNFARTMIGLKGKKGDPVWQRLNTAQKVATGLVMGSFAIAMLNRAAAGEDDDGENWYDKVPDYVKERNLVIMKSVFGGDQDGSYWTIPLPYGYNIFHVLGNSVEATTNGNTGIGEAATDLTLAALGSFSPIGFQESQSLTGTIVRNITPTLGKPLVDIGFNENFMGTSIYNENFPFGTPKPESQLGRRSTPEGYKAIAEFLNDVSGGSQWRSGYIDINPDVMRYMANYFTGAAGKFVFDKAPNNLYHLATLTPIESREALFWSRVSGKVLPYDDREKFYIHRDEINQTEAEWKGLTGGDRLRFYRENRRLISLRPLVKSSEKQLKALRQQRDRIYAMDLPRKQQEARMEVIEARMKRVIDRFNREYAKATGGD